MKDLFNVFLLDRNRRQVTMKKLFRVAVAAPLEDDRIQQGNAQVPTKSQDTVDGLVSLQFGAASLFE
jgi:hypothetical protein